MRTIKPLGDRLLIQPIEEGEVILGGLHIPDFKNKTSKTSQRAKVLEAGPKCVLAKKGDIVMVEAYGGEALSGGDIYHMDGVKVILTREAHIIGVLQ